jgi:vacuolar-type H+-ATPase subunit I/STV1
MAVVPMQKVQVVVHRTDTDALLDVLQRSGAMEFVEVDTTNIASISMEFPQAQLLPRVQHAIGFLTPYEAKRSLWRTLRDGSTTELSEAEVVKQAADTEAVAQVVSELETLQVEYAEKTDIVRQLEEQVVLLQLWKAVPIKLAELKTASTYTRLVQVGTDTQKGTTSSLLATLTEFLQAQDIPSQITSVSATLAAVTVAADAATPADL